MDKFIPNQPSDPVIGLPPAGDLTDMNTIYQGYDDTCAIRSQEIILRDFGIEISQEQLIAESQIHGWYDGNGTSLDNIGNLLELHGIGLEKYSDGSVVDLVNNLAQGKRIIVGVDSGELWNSGFFEDLEDVVLGDRPDHALIVAGIDCERGVVVLTDPGTGHVAKSYPLEQFLDAWADSGHFMIATDQPAPATASGMTNFDYERRHITFIGDMSYEDWLDSVRDELTLPEYHSFDSDGDGIVDTRLLDSDHDGIFDTRLQDLDNDGIFEVQSFDFDGDGKIDMQYVDTDGNGQFDQVLIDSDADGQIDTKGVDLDGDGSIDIVLQDTTGDGMADQMIADVDNDGQVDRVDISDANIPIPDR